MPARPAAKSKKKLALSKPAKKAATKTARVRAVPAKAVKPAARAAKPAAKAAVKTKAAPKAAAPRKATAKARPAPKPPAPRVVPINPEFVKFRDLLLAERTRLEAELEEIEARTARATDAERATELSSYEDHPADLASETFEREKDLAIAESVESLYNQVNTALEKIDHGTYGVCDACARPIKKARLQALPFATLCLECQGRLEG
jgi:RNA polymerase-binding protein DksA